MKNNDGLVRDPYAILSEEEYDDTLIGERPEADDEEAVDKYLNAELIMDIGSGNERRDALSKEHVVQKENQLDVHILTLYLTPESIWWSLQMDLRIAIRLMSSRKRRKKTCLHR
jgi:hypothetical protein